MKKIVVFMLGIAILGGFIVPGTVLADELVKENSLDQVTTLDDVDFDLTGDADHIIMPRESGRGSCRDMVRSGRRPANSCDSAGRPIGNPVKITAKQKNCLIALYGTGIDGAFAYATGGLWWAVVGIHGLKSLAGCV